MLKAIPRGNNNDYYLASKQTLTSLCACEITKTLLLRQYMKLYMHLMFICMFCEYRVQRALNEHTIK